MYSLEVLLLNASVIETAVWKDEWSRNPSNHRPNQERLEQLTYNDFKAQNDKKMLLTQKDLSMMIMEEWWLVNVTCYSLNVGFEGNLSEAPVPTQDVSSVTGKFNLNISSINTNLGSVLTYRPNEWINFCHQKKWANIKDKSISQCYHWGSHQSSVL